MLAQNLDSIQSQGLPGFVGGKNIGEFITKSKILDYVFGAAAIAMLVYLVTAGLQMMLARGNPKEMEGAQHKITNAILGFVIIVIAFFVVQLLAQLFKSTGTGGFGESFIK